jgi:hypothetical protein
VLILTIEIAGHDWNDLEYALEEVTRLVRETYTSGTNANDTGGFTFDISGEPEASPVGEEASSDYEEAV